MNLREYSAPTRGPSRCARCSPVHARLRHHFLRPTAVGYIAPPGMQPPIVPAHPLRRLGALLLTLSVLVTSLGWAHLICGAVTEQSAGAAATASRPGEYPGVHPGAAGMQAVDGASGTRIGVAPEGASGDAGRPADQCAGHGCQLPSQSTSETDGCTMEAHCTAAFAPSAVAVHMPASHAPTQPIVPSSSRLLERAYQPDAPPPRA